MAIFRRGPSNGGVECREYEKNRDFRPISRFISEMIQDRAIINVERQYKLVCDLSNSAILNDLE